MLLEIGEEFEPHWGDSHHAFITSFFGQSRFDKKLIRPFVSPRWCPSTMANGHK